MFPSYRCSLFILSVFLLCFRTLVLSFVGSRSYLIKILPLSFHLSYFLHSLHNSPLPSPLPFSPVLPLTSLPLSLSLSLSLFPYLSSSLSLTFFINFWVSSALYISPTLSLLSRSSLSPSSLSPLSPSSLCPLSLSWINLYANSRLIGTSTSSCIRNKHARTTLMNKHIQRYGLDPRERP